ncbi:MAG: MBL fold metallo-hydrolase [Sphingomonas sp.]|uniref:MBL fold metallo-hydrolase n=1 Tax=Sphingomonas sp. TaxID=28214 RepID=UPI0025D95FBD|nr:MBL fold metallo-hydrolase [Sphingomonas sp.]MBX3563357.1 MBL fold metallo-hydrolase [Sphingomonas sp.]
MRFVRAGAAILLWTVVALCLAATVIPHFLDRIYYRGAVSGHFDGAHFFNPDGDDDRLKVTGPGSRVRFIWKQVFGDSERPVWPGKVAVTRAKPPARIEDGRMLVTWVGHATLLVQADGVNILTDPVWSTHAGPFGFGPKRVAEPGIAFDDLPRIDIVLISHNHYDHMDLATLKRLWRRDRPLIVTSLGNDAILRGAGIPGTALDWRGSTGIGKCPPAFADCPARVTVTATRSHHWDSRWFTDRNRALWSSFVVKLPSGNFFFAGDTGYGDGQWPAEAAALGPIRLAAIPIGAFRFEAGQMVSGSHIGPREAIRVWDGLGRPFAVPIHWGTFRLSWEGRETPPEMLKAMLGCAHVDPTRFAATRIGETVEVPALGAAPPPPDLKALTACETAGRFAALR